MVLLRTVISLALFVFIAGNFNPITAQSEDETKNLPDIVYPRKSGTEGANVNTNGVDRMFGESDVPIGMLFSLLGYVIVFGGICVCVWYFYKRGAFGKKGGSSDGKLRITENRMLGNRQFLMVVEYEHQKILLGVGPGKIDYLTTLQGSYPVEESSLEDQLARAMEAQQK